DGGGQAGRACDGAAGLRLPRMAETAELGTGGRRLEAIYRDMYRGFRSGPLHVREQFSARQGSGQLPGDLQRLQASLLRLQREREDCAVLQDRRGFLSAEVLARRRIGAQERPGPALPSPPNLAGTSSPPRADQPPQ